jgi:hypothetical protein
VVIVVGVFVILLTGCISFPTNILYDENIPENERCILIVPEYITIDSFDEEYVQWKPKSTVTIPSGEHRITFAYYKSSVSVTSSIVSTSRSTADGILTFNFIAYRKYALLTESAGDYLRYWIDYVGIMPLAVPNENETLVSFKKTGLGDYPSYVHIKGGDSIITFYLPRGDAIRFIIPNGAYTIYGSKSREGNGGTPLEIEAHSEEIAIDVIGPNLFTQPGIKLGKPK